jgi:hypothetical protein
MHIIKQACGHDGQARVSVSLKIKTKEFGAQ